MILRMIAKVHLSRRYIVISLWSHFDTPCQH